MVVYTDAELWAEQLSTKPLPVVSGDLTGKNIIVTGANIGLGLEACKYFAKMNPAKLILACRSMEKAQAAIKEIGYAAAEAWELDLSSFKSVSAFADCAEKELGRLDVLVANAAVATFELTVTADGYEQMCVLIHYDGWYTTHHDFRLQVNVLGNLLLAIRLAPLLVKTSKTYGTLSRLVTVSSGVAHTTKLDAAVLEGKTNVFKAMSDPDYLKTASNIARYSESKIMEIFYARSLQASIGDTPLVVTCIDPGFCLSGLRRHAEGPIKDVFAHMEKEGAYTSEEGSRQLVYGAVGQNPEAMKGQLLAMSAVHDVSDYVLEGAEIQRRVWNDAIEALEAVDAMFKPALQSLKA
ncbi:NAD(P)-binding protein [Cylindrobasidium torrendii FP15055 ss-10]|uniref:NAD(P)-binding protein n=1 Tax=Cylindrobasidium torrendii FP15055 ss-10 TaxID=1314674 RepID=A0A0D7AWC6_9AGAR|nr:NAD(P)-binding protein [Cylindrobasidium torrendii FP15055 ss-10]